jgi:serine O-acetyltransferase
MLFRLKYLGCRAVAGTMNWAPLVAPRRGRIKARQNYGMETSGALNKPAATVRSAPFWLTVRADVARLREEDPGLRALMRGLLSQGFQALVVYRIFRWFYERGIPTQPLRFIVERLTEITTGISIPTQAELGKGLRIHHFGGIIVHSETVIGEDCTIYHGITLGDLGGWGGAPRIGNQVVIGAGAKILGRIEIGDRCYIGANAVVRTSVPAGCIAVGVPAVVKARDRRVSSDLT